MAGYWPRSLLLFFLRCLGPETAEKELGQCPAIYGACVNHVVIDVHLVCAAVEGGFYCLKQLLTNMLQASKALVKLIQNLLANLKDSCLTSQIKVILNLNIFP